MKNKRRLRSGLRKNDMQEAFALTLNQKRHDAAGNRVVGYDFEQIMAMTPRQRAAVKHAAWMGNKTREGNHGRR